MVANFRRLLIGFLSLVALTSNAQSADHATRGGAGSHGGSRLQSDFFKGQRQAGHIVNVASSATGKGI